MFFPSATPPSQAFRCPPNRGNTNVIAKHGLAGLLALAAGAKRLLGRYIPTSRNELVKDHYAKLGFSLLTQHEDGSSNCDLDLAALGPADLPMEIRRAGFTAAPGSPWGQRW